MVSIDQFRQIGSRWTPAVHSETISEQVLKTIGHTGRDGLSTGPNESAAATRVKDNEKILVDRRRWFVPARYLPLRQQQHLPAAAPVVRRPRRLCRRRRRGPRQVQCVPSIDYRLFFLAICCMRVSVRLYESALFMTIHPIAILD